MKVLLDECLPRKLKRELPGHEVSTVPEMGWSGVKNGALLALAQQQFEVFITIDGSLPHQQNLASTSLALVVLAAADNTFPTLKVLMPEVLARLNAPVMPGEHVRIAARED